MPTDFEELAQAIRAMEQQHQAEMNRISKSVTLPDIDRMGSVMAQQLKEAADFSKKQAQAPLDTVATLEQIVQMLEDNHSEQTVAAQKLAADAAAQARLEQKRFIINIIIGSISAIAAVIAAIAAILALIL